MAFGQRSNVTSDKLCQLFEGQLFKYTNVMKGWQYRWFVLVPEAGVLSYYLNETERMQRPRGSVHLAAAVISPSDEDSNTFTVNSATGEMFKLRASDARARHEWVSRIRAITEMHTMAIAHSNPPLSPRKHHSISVSPAAPSVSSYCSLALLDAFTTVQDHLHQAEASYFQVCRIAEALPSFGTDVKSSDHGILLLKATSNATVMCLGQCLSILQHQQIAPLTISQPTVTSHVSSNIFIRKNSQPSSILPVLMDEELMVEKGFSSVSSSLLAVSPNTYKQDSDLHINDDLTDEEDEEEIATVAVEEHKSVILHLLSQLKLGMDLTRVVLPTFILERRSLLEMFADSMGHHHLFINITNQTSPYLRMLSALEWYLTSFHIGRKSSVAKKPYNPIIGETFHCSWKLTSLDENVDEIYTAEKSDLICYTAEQVSHHPPVTAFYAECRQRQICLNASIWTKSNFSGMSVGVNMIGEVSLFLGEHGEQYDFTLPAAYARSIISIPWIELGGKVNINCPSTGYLANIIFHTKPFYGGKVNQVTAEVKNETGAIISRVQGEWNNHFEFTYGNGETKTIYVDELPVCKKRVRPLSKQEKMESRKLWCNVTHALREGDISAATEYKRDIEERQRIEERLRAEEEISFPTRYFHKEQNTWYYNNLLVEL